MFLLLGSVLAILGEGWLVFGIPGRLFGLGLIVLGFGESAFWAYRALRGQEQLPQEFTQPTWIAAQTQFRRHVALRPDGEGVTFYLETDDRGQSRWTWTYDEGVAPGQSAQNPGVLHTIDQAIFRMNEDLGLPQHPSSPPWATEAPRKDLPGWPWDRLQEANEAGPRTAEDEVPPRERESRGRFYGQVNLACGDSIMVLAIEPPEAGDIRRCPMCRVDRAVTHVFP